MANTEFEVRSTPKLRYIIVGYGNIGHKRQNTIGKKCVATVDPNPAAEADYRDHRQVPLEIFDAAVLTVPQQVKLNQVEYFLASGKHVLVEKPLIITRVQEKRLLGLTKKKRVICYTSYNHRFEPNIIGARRAIERGVIGGLYHGRLVYGFGDIKERIGTWRETEFGVLEEIAPHLLDFAINTFGYKGRDFRTIFARRMESKIFDHWLCATEDNKLIIEVSSVMWKNVFSLDVYGSLGSFHMQGLRKWGGSQLTIRKRVFPSGVPKEKQYFDQGEDVTWREDFKHFETQVAESKNTLENDLQIAKALTKLSKEAAASYK